MTRPIIVFLLGFTLVTAGRALPRLVVAPAEVPEPAEVESTAPADDDPRPVVARHHAAQRPAPPRPRVEPAERERLEGRVGRAPDLRRADQLVAHLVGDPIPWDDPAARSAGEAEMRDLGERVEAAGVGRMLGLDCESCPCVGLMVGKPSGDGRFWQEMAGFVLAGVWRNIEADGEDAVLFTVRTASPDVPAYEPHVYNRMIQLQYRHTSPWARPTDEAVAEPIAWPEVAR